MFKIGEHLANTTAFDSRCKFTRQSLQDLARRRQRLSYYRGLSGWPWWLLINLALVYSPRVWTKSSATAEKQRVTCACIYI